MSLVDKTILVIDDDEAILDLVRRVIEGTGAICVTAQSVKEGVALALSKAPHLIITDLSMPEIDGFTFLEKKKSIPQIRSTPTLVFSAVSEKKELNRAMALGAVDYLSKPLKAALLLQKIRKSLHEEEQASSHRFSEKPRIEAQIHGELKGVNEEFVFFESVAKLSPGKTVHLKSPFLEECGLKNQVLKVVRRSGSSEAMGQYLAKAKFMGLIAEVALNITGRIRSWK